MTEALVSRAARREIVALEENQGANPSPDAVREQLVMCDVIAYMFEKQWQRVDALMNRGIEGNTLRLFVKEFRDSLELGILAFNKMSERAREVEITDEEKREAILKLNQSTGRSRKMVEDLSKLLLRLETPPAALDVSTLPAGGKEKEAKGFISSRDFFSRLRSGDETKRMA